MYLLACLVRVIVGDSDLCSCVFDVFSVLINSLVYSFYTGALGLILFKIVTLLSVAE